MSDNEVPPTSGEQHAALAVFLGRWRAEGTSYGSPEQSEEDPRREGEPWVSTHTGNGILGSSSTYRTNARLEEGEVVKRILLTGMSGTGKSTLISELALRGYKAVDADGDAFSEWVEVSGDSGIPGSPVEPDRDWVWREDRIQALLSTQDTDVLFLSGCAQNIWVSPFAEGRLT